MNKSSVNKSDICRNISKELGIPYNETYSMVDFIINNLSESLINNEKTSIKNFGSFRVAEKSSRKGRNPKSGQEHTIEAYKTAKFTPAQKLKNLINNK